MRQQPVPALHSSYWWAAKFGPIRNASNQGHRRGKGQFAWAHK